MRQQVYAELCDIKQIDFVQMVVTVENEYGSKMNFPVVYSGTVSDATDYNQYKAFILYTDVVNETGVAFITPRGLFNKPVADQNSKKPKFTVV